MSAVEAIRIPAGTPDAVVNTVRYIASHSLHPYDADVLARLATDPRMAGVWAELTRCNSAGTAFLHQARPPAHASPRARDEAQADALAELLFFAWATASERKAVSKPSQVEDEREALRKRAATLRECAAHPAQAAEASALRRAADRYEGGIASLRTRDDPMMVTNNRGDAVVRGVQTLITAFLVERFGSRLDGTAATLAAVALDARTTARAGRSALSG